MAAYVYAIVAGTKVKIGKTNVKFTGNWEIEVPFTNFPTRIEYQPRNYFFSFADISENAWYSFTSGAVYNTSLNGTINEYTQAVYSANSDLLNLGELYGDGMKMLVTLANKGGGIAPEREESIVVYYPNDEEECNHDEPWSCSADAGFIWLIPEHAAGRAVMIHELTHQMHYEYWGNDLPGTSAPHPPFDCTDKGQALVEGFADFVVHWVRFNRLTNPSGDSVLPIENPEDACDDNSDNQLWVSATLWDMYDSLDDGSDFLRFTKRGRRLAFSCPTTIARAWMNSEAFTSSMRAGRLQSGSRTPSTRTIRINRNRTEYQNENQSIYCSRRSGHCRRACICTNDRVHLPRPTVGRIAAGERKLRSPVRAVRCCFRRW